MISLLIADDHPVVRNGLRGIFTGDPDFEVLGEAASGVEAVALAVARRPQVVLMDLRMPGGDGVTAIRELAERLPATRVLVLTTYGDDGDVLAAIDAGATGYLLKDAPREELLRGVRAAARGESVLSPSVAATAARARPCARARDPAEPARAGGAHAGRRAARPTARPPRGCSSPRPRSRRTCCTSTPSSG